MEGGGAREPLCSLQPCPPGLQVCLVPSRPPCLDLLKSWGLRAVLSPVFAFSSPTWDWRPEGVWLAFFHPSLFPCSRPFLGEQGREATDCKPRGSFSFFLKPLYPQPKRQCSPATSKPGIVHSLGLVSLYNGCYLYEGQFVNSTCSFNKRMFY